MKPGRIQVVKNIITSDITLAGKYNHPLNVPLLTLISILTDINSYARVIPLYTKILKILDLPFLNTIVMQYHSSKYLEYLPPLRHTLISSILPSYVVKYDYFFEGRIQNTLEEGKKVKFILQLSSKKIIVTSRNDISVWNIETFERELSIHTPSIITAIAILDVETIVCGFSSGSISIYNTRNGLHSLISRPHRSRIMVLLKLVNNTFASAALSDTVIKIWNRDLVHVHDLVGHVSRIVCCTVVSNTLISGSFDGEIKMWNLNTGECEHTLNGEGYISSIHDLKDGRILSVSNNLKIWSLEGVLQSTLTVTYFDLKVVMPRSCVILSKDRVACTYEDNTLKIWNLSSKTYISSEINKIESIHVLPNTDIISESSRVWDSTTLLERKDVNFESKHILVLTDGRVACTLNDTQIGILV